MPLSFLNNVNKTKIAWIVSHCHTTSDREGYVQELQKYISVDIFGNCGSHKCAHWNCLESLSKNYMFYLSFENSLCKDYVTEKFFQALSKDILPIVYGDMNYEDIAPPKSYINALHYENPKDLSKQLKVGFI